MRSRLRRCNFLSRLQSPQPAGGSQAREGSLPAGGYPTGDEPPSVGPSFLHPLLVSTSPALSKRCPTGRAHRKLHNLIWPRCSRHHYTTVKFHCLFLSSP